VSASVNARNSPGIIVMRGVRSPMGRPSSFGGSFARAVAGFKGTLAHQGACLLPFLSQWPDSNIRILYPWASLRMLESKDRWLS
jgi:hypothetical protein